MDRTKPSLTVILLLILLAVTGCSQATGTPVVPTLTPAPTLTDTPVASDLTSYPWLYLRDGRPLEPGEGAVEVILVGDVMLGRGVAGESDPLGLAAPWLRAADLAVGNFEGAISPDGLPTPDPAAESPTGPYLLVAPPAAAGQLAQAGFDLLGLANNHAYDRGLEGLGQTAHAIKEQGLAVIGAGPTPDDAYRPFIFAGGGRRIAFLAFNAVPSPRGADWTGEVIQSDDLSGWALAGWDQERALQAVRQAAAEAEAVVVSIHWGYEYDPRVDPAQRHIAALLAEAGADLIAGHHPHVVQDAEWLEAGAFAAFSLGNFVFDQGQEGTDRGLALRAFFDEQGLRAVQGLPVRAGLRPSLYPPEAADPALAPGETSATTLAFACDAQGCRPAQVDPGEQGTGSNPTSPGDMGPRALALDLTGDGAPETIRLDHGRLSLAGGGGPDWTNPPEWQVIDLAGGDPNHDGRQELVLALRKPDRLGIVLTHPFVLGYRQGEYRLLWGGSAASEPILEIELADVDGDGEQELVVLEELPNAETGRTVSVWRWNGWGFSLAWRSDAGRFTNLRVVAREKQDIILVDVLSTISP